MTNILISIKPKYSRQIFAGTKTIELRKTFPVLPNNTIAYVYESTPTKAIVGKFNIFRLSQSPLRQEYLEFVWNCYHENLGIEESEFFKYYEGAKVVTALFIKSPILFDTPISLQKMKSIQPSAPPQSFCYILNELEKLLKS